MSKGKLRAITRIYLIPEEKVLLHKRAKLGPWRLVCCVNVCICYHLVGWYIADAVKAAVVFIYLHIGMFVIKVYFPLGMVSVRSSHNSKRGVQNEEQKLLFVCMMIYNEKRLISGTSKVITFRNDLSMSWYVFPEIFTHIAQFYNWG